MNPTRIVAAIAVCAAITSCGEPVDPSASDLECNSIEQAERALTAVRAPSAREAAATAFDIWLAPEVEVVRSDGGVFKALLRGRVVGSTEPVRVGAGQFEVAEGFVCGPRSS